MIELWHEWNSVQSFKVRVVLGEKDLSWTGHQIELLKFEHLQPDYLKINPNGVVPTLVHDGRILLESSVICQYLEDTFPQVSLMLPDPYARARARFWLKFFDEVAHPAIRQASFELLYRPFLMKLPPAELEARLARHPDPERASRFRRATDSTADPAAIKESLESFRIISARVEAALQEDPWLAGARFTLADVAMAPFVERLDHLGLTGLSKSFPNLNKWSAALLVRPSVIKARAPIEHRLAAHFPCELIDAVRN